MGQKGIWALHIDVETPTVHWMKSPIKCALKYTQFKNYTNVPSCWSPFLSRKYLKATRMTFIMQEHNTNLPNQLSKSISC